MNRASFGPRVMWRGIITSCALLVAMCMMATCAQATPVALGTFDGDAYTYEDEHVFHQENVAIVWVYTTSQKFNYSDDTDYAGAAGKFGIDCSGHTTVFIEGVTFDKRGKEIQHGKIPQNKWKFVPIQQHTPEYALYKAICVLEPVI